MSVKEKVQAFFASLPVRAGTLGLWLVQQKQKLSSALIVFKNRLKNPRTQPPIIGPVLPLTLKSRISGLLSRLPLPIRNKKIIAAFIGILLLIISGAVALIVYRNLTAYSIYLTNAPGNSGYLYQSKTKDNSILLGNSSNKPVPKVKFSFKDAVIEMYSADKVNTGTLPVKTNSQTLTYNNLFKDTSLNYQIGLNRIKEQIVIYNVGAKRPDYSFNFFLGNAFAKNGLDGKPTGVFYNATTLAYAFHFELPYMVDAKGVRGEVLMNIKSTDYSKQTLLPNMFTVTLTPDPYWLEDPKRAWPVTIDPTITHSQSSDFATGTYGNGTYNRVEDTGSGASPNLTSSLHELPADINTVGLWHMNEAAGATCGSGKDVCDYSGNANDGTLSGSTIPTWNTAANSQLGNSSLAFNGTTAFVGVGTGASLNVTTYLTIEAWVKLGSLAACGGAQPPTIFGSTASNGYALLFQANCTVALTKVGVSNATSTGKIVDTNWHHIAVTYDGANARFYFDGVLDSTIAYATTFGTGMTYNIGTTASGYFMNGSLDEIRISNIARTAEEIKQDAQSFPYAVYTSPVLDLNLTGRVTSWNWLIWTGLGLRTSNVGDGETLPSTTNLVAQWKFNETSGTSAADSSGNGRTAALQAGFASTASQDQAPGTGWTAANARWGAGALMFDGTNDWALVTYNAALNITGNLTMGAWIKTTNGAGNMDIISRYGTTPYPGYAIGVQGGYFVCWVGDNTLGWFTSNRYVSDGQWHFVTCTLNSTTVSTYIDGFLSNSGSRTPNLNNVTSNLALGSNSTGGGNWFNGVMDEATIYSRALTAGEILASYQSGNIEFLTRTGTNTTPDSTYLANGANWEQWKPFANETPMVTFDGPYQYNTTDANLVSYWPMDEASGTTVADVKGSNTATATGTTFIADGKFGKSRALNGTSGSYINIPGLTFTATAFTVEFWFKPVSCSNYNNQIGAINSWGAFQFQTDSNCAVFVGTDSTNRFTPTDLPANTITLNQWQHVVYTYDGSQGRFYKNGQLLVGPKTMNSPTAWGGMILGQVDAQTINGSIDEVRVYSAAITAATVLQHWQEGITEAGSNRIGVSTDTNIKMEGSGSLNLDIGAPLVDGNTVSLWHFEETSGSSAYLKDSVPFQSGFAPDTGNSLLTNLVAFWKMDEASGTNVQESINALNGTSSGTSVVTGKLGNARSFTANTNNITRANNSLLNFTGDFTISVWVKSGQACVNGNYPTAIYKEDFDVGAGTRVGYGIVANNGFNCVTHNWYGEIWVNNVQYSAPGGSIIDNNWHNLVFKRSGTQLYAYQDGVNQSGAGGVTAVSGSVSNSNQLFLGSDTNWVGYFYNGYLDEVGLWNRALTAQEITDLYNPVYGTGWGNSYYGARGGNNATPAGANSTADGYFGKARNFSGASGDYVTLPFSSGFNVPVNGNFSEEAWIKTSTINKAIMGLQSNTPLIYFQVGATTVGTSGNTIGVALRDDGGTLSAFNGTSNVADGKWHHVAMTAATTGASRTVILYVDGKQESYNSWPTANSVTQVPSLWSGAVGALSNTYNFNGLIDEVKFSNVARTPEEIADAYRAGQGNRYGITIGSANLSAKTKVPFYVAADRPGRYLEATIGNNQFVNYEPDVNTVGLWHLDETSNYNWTLLTQLVDNGAVGFNQVGNSLPFTALKAECADGSHSTIATFSTPQLANTTTGLTSNNGYKVMLGAAGQFGIYNTSQNTCNWASDLGMVGSGFDGASCGTYPTSLRTGYGGNSTNTLSTRCNVNIYIGNSLKDSSGYGNHGYPIGTSIVQGKIGKARYFPAGNSDFITTGNSGLNFEYSNPFSIDAWIQTPGSAAYKEIVSKVLNSPYPGYLFRVNTSNQLEFIFIGATSGFTWVHETAKVFNDNQWHHVAATYSGSGGASGMKLYVDGQEMALVTDYDNRVGTITNAGNLMIGLGNNFGNDAFLGSIDEVRVSNIARSAADIRAAFEYGKRTHPINIDFVTNPHAAYTSGTSVTINNPYGTTALTNTLSIGDTVVFEENVNGTMTVSQSVVNSIANTSSSYGTVTLSSAPSFPSGGYSTNAKVFKWQREFFDITGSLGASQRNAITRITLRDTDGSQGANVWLDDMRYNTGYISDNIPDSFNTTTGVGTYSNSGITSTANRYFQYQAIFSSWDTPVSPSLTSVTLDYNVNSPPSAPTYVSPPTPLDTATGVTGTPAFSIYSTDADSNSLQYKIQLDTVNTFDSANLQTFDETASQTNWTGQNAQSGAAYNPGVGSPATYTIPSGSALNQGTLYYIRAYAKDPLAYGGSDIWSTASTTRSFTTAIAAVATGCFAGGYGSANAAHITWVDNLSNEINYYVERSINGGAFSALQTIGANINQADDTGLSSGTYIYRVRAFTSDNVYTAYCTTNPFVIPLQSMQLQGVGLQNIKIR